MIRKIPAALVIAALTAVLAGCGSMKMPGIPGFGKKDKDVEDVVADADGVEASAEETGSAPEIVFVPPSQDGAGGSGGQRGGELRL